MFLDLIPARDAQGHLALSDEGGDVGCGEEDERNGVVFDEGDVEAIGATELDVGAGEEVEGGVLEAAFFGDGEEEAVGEVVD